MKTDFINMSFQEFLENELKQATENSYEKLRQDIEAKDINLIKKIQNYISRFYLNASVDEICDKIKNDYFFAMFFLKDPKKKNFYEIKQLEFLKRTIPDIKKLSNIIYIENTGKLTNRKTENTTKSIDFISEKEKTLYVAKHINENGGSQDNQFHDMIQFAKYWKPEEEIKNPEHCLESETYEYKLELYNFKLCLVYSGNYFQQSKIIKILDSLKVAKMNLNENVKKSLGQFYTTKWQTILQNLEPKLPENTRIIEPFVGTGELLSFCESLNPQEILKYDIDSKIPDTIQQDTLKNPPNYENAVVITNPPYLARNKAKSKDLYDKYNTNDLYKCFLLELVQQKPYSGVLILPLNFWCGTRKADNILRGKFLELYEITQLNIFTTPVFQDTDYTVCSFSFVYKPNSIRKIPVKIFTNKEYEKIELILQENENWIIANEILNIKQNPRIKFIRIIENQEIPNMIKAKFHLHALDNSKKIRMEIGEYVGKKTSRTEASWYWNLDLPELDQKYIAESWNKFINIKREKYQSLFLSNYRENNRKRISFDLAVKILNKATHNYLKRNNMNLTKYLL